MFRTKYTTTSTGTTLTLTADTGFVALDSQQYTALGGTGHVLYVLIAENGTDWEVGYGTLSGSTLTRATGQCFNSSGGAGGPGFYYDIILTAGTHTVYFTHEFYTGHVLVNRYKNDTGVSVSGSGTQTNMGTLTKTLNGLTYAYAANGANSTVVGAPGNEVMYARGYKVHFSARTSDTGGDAWGITMTLNDNGDEIVGASGVLDGGDHLITCSTPMIDMRPPFPDSTVSSHSLYSGDFITYIIWNDKTSAITVDPQIMIEWYL